MGQSPECNQPAFQSQEIAEMLSQHTHGAPCRLIQPLKGTPCVLFGDQVGSHRPAVSMPGGQHSIEENERTAGRLQGWSLGDVCPSFQKRPFGFR